MKIDITKLSATDLDELIDQASRLRMTLQPEHSFQAPQEIAAIDNPAWFTVLTDVGTLLQLRHPGFGWMSFIIPDQERAHLLALLLQQALLANSHGNKPVTTTAPTTATPPSGGGGKLH